MLNIYSLIKFKISNIFMGGGAHSTHASPAEQVHFARHPPHCPPQLFGTSYASGCRETTCNSLQEVNQDGQKTINNSQGTTHIRQYSFFCTRQLPSDLLIRICLVVWKLVSIIDGLHFAFLTELTMLINRFVLILVNEKFLAFNFCF